jgi:hypothetical protein
VEEEVSMISDTERSTASMTKASQFLRGRTADLTFYEKDIFSSNLGEYFL